MSFHTHSPFLHCVNRTHSIQPEQQQTFPATKPDPMLSKKFSRTIRFECCQNTQQLRSWLGGAAVWRRRGPRLCQTRPGPGPPAAPGGGPDRLGHSSQQPRPASSRRLGAAYVRHAAVRPSFCGGPVPRPGVPPGGCPTERPNASLRPDSEESQQFLPSKGGTNNIRLSLIASCPCVTLCSQLQMLLVRPAEAPRRLLLPRSPRTTSETPPAWRQLTHTSRFCL